jgi:hypothetical protein
MPFPSDKDSRILTIKPAHVNAVDVEMTAANATHADDYRATSRWGLCERCLVPRESGREP